MASVKSPLQRKLERILKGRFPPPATIRLEEHDGIIGVVTSATFAGMDTMDRQDLMGDLIDAHLSQVERRQVQMIVCVTPDEETGYLASVD